MKQMKQVCVPHGCGGAMKRSLACVLVAVAAGIALADDYNIDSETTWSGQSVDLGTSTSFNKKKTGKLVLDNCQINAKTLNVFAGTLVLNGETAVTTHEVVTGSGCNIGIEALGILRLNSGSYEGLGVLHVGGHGSSRGYGVYFQNGGSFANTNASVCVGRRADATGEVYVVKGRLATAGGNGSNVQNESRVGHSGRGTLSVGGEGTVDVSASDSLQIAKMAGATGCVTLGNGGTLAARTVVGSNGDSSFVFDGGTLVATNSPVAATFITGLKMLAMTENGGGIDSGANNVTVAQPIVRTTAGLAHRYSFNGNLKDSVAGRDAVGASVQYSEDGRCVQTTGQGSHVEIPTETIPMDGSAMTIEMWATLKQGNSNYGRFLEIGRERGNENNAISMRIYTEKDGTYNNDSIHVATNGSNKGLIASNKLRPFEFGTEYHMAIIVEPQGNVWKVSGYKQDATTGETLNSASFFCPAGWSLAELAATWFWLGGVPYMDNRFAVADFNEVRIWHRALGEHELAYSAMLGPDAVFSRGVFEKIGSGTLTLTGANTFEPATCVSQGTLALASGASLASPSVEVAPGAVFSLAGNTYAGEVALDVSESGAGRIVCASGALDLSGIDLKVVTQSGFKPSSKITLATSAGGFSGEFKSVTLPGGSWKVNVGATDVTLCRFGFVLIVK